MMKLLLVIFSAAPLSYLFCGLLLRYAGHWGLIDIPNDRSSHQTPVPRAGGIALAFVFLSLLPLIQIQLETSPSLFLSIYGAGAVVALLGFFDDRGHIPARKRLVIHFIAALWVLYHIQKFTTPHPSGPDFSLLFTSAGSLLLLVWLLNLYNFMDGIDAITGSETISVGLCAAFLSWLLIPQDPSWLILLLLVSSVTGFQAMNLPPARLFMGDAGSAFLGIVLGTLILYAFHQSTILFCSWLILLGVYIIDATLTLFRRILAGEKFYQAHRTHAYQHAAIRFKSHALVSLAVALINLFWLFPIALAVAFETFSPTLGLFISYIPLILIAIHFKAGKRQLLIQ